jgi:hypothetical protein
LDNIRLKIIYFMEIRTGQLKDLQVLTEFNVNLAKETENKDLNSELVQKGVQTIIENPSKGTYYVAEVNQQVVACLMITFQ